MVGRLKKKTDQGEGEKCEKLGKKRKKESSLDFDLFMTPGKSEDQKDQIIPPSCIFRNSD